jgi:hypothetical protein
MWVIYSFVWRESALLSEFISSFLKSLQMFYRFLLACLFLAIFYFPAHSHDALASAGFHKSNHIFIENKGQVTDQFGTASTDVDFKLVAVNGLNLFIGKGGLHYQWVKSPVAANKNVLFNKNKRISASPVEMYRMDVRLIGCNPNATITKEQPTAYAEHYYMPSVGSNGLTANAYGRITYHDIYPNIDWVFYFNGDGKLEHDFIIRPGGNAADIKLQYDGAKSINVSEDGSLTTVTPFGMVNEHAPYGYNQNDKRKIESAFVLHDNLLSFSTAKSKGTVVIDPTLEWGTYFGGNDADIIYDLVTAKDNCTYITGGTSSVSNIATTGSYQYTYNGGTGYLNDAFIAKFNSTGNCVWSTYYGGAGEDDAKSISSDTSGNLYIAGFTYGSIGLATAGAHQLTSGGSYDVFIAKFDTSGQRVWGTYFGGTGEDGWGPVALHCDKGNHLYLTGQTNSSNNIATNGAAQATLFGGIGDQDAFLAKFQTDGTFIWGTYFGGNFADAAYAITNDATGNIIIVGATNSTAGIATTGQTTNGGSNDAFIAKYDPSGVKTWSTYFGGNSDDYGLGIDCDSIANVYLTGTTISTSGLATTSANQTVYGGGYQDAMLAKFNSSGSLLWSTYYGGSSEDEGDKVICAPNGGIYISGFTGSDTGMVTTGAPQTVLGGAYDGLVARFSNTGSLIWGSYIGGFDYEEAYSVSTDASGNLYIGGNTTSASGIATTGAWQVNNNGGDYDGFLLRLKDCTPPSNPDTILGMLNVCAGSSSSFNTAAANAVSYNWILPSGWAGNSNTNAIGITFDGNGGILKVVAENDCAASDTASVSITVNALPQIPEVVLNGNVLSVPSNYSSYQWLNDGQPISGANTATYTPGTAGNYAVIVFNVAGCSDTSVIFGYATSVSNVLANNSIRVFPNPATTLVYIKSALNIRAALYSADGKLLMAKELFKGTSVLSLNDLSKGIYAIRFTDVNGCTVGMQQLIISGN